MMTIFLLNDYTRLNKTCNVEIDSPNSHLLLYYLLLDYQQVMLQIKILYFNNQNIFIKKNHKYAINSI